MYLFPLSLYICIPLSLSLYIYIYVHKHISIYLSIYLSLSLSIYIYIYIYICAYTHICGVSATFPPREAEEGSEDVVRAAEHRGHLPSAERQLNTTKSNCTNNITLKDAEGGAEEVLRAAEHRGSATRIPDQGYVVILILMTLFMLRYHDTNPNTDTTNNTDDTIRYQW